MWFASREIMLKEEAAFNICRIWNLFHTQKRECATKEKI